MRAPTAPRSQRQTTLTRGATALLAGAIVVGAFGTIPGQGADAAQAAPATSAYNRVATYPVFQNVPAGVDAALPTVAEISAVTDDGNTVIYTDALGKRIGFLDITDPAAPTGLGTISLADLGHADDQPTSVAVYGDYVLVVIDESGDDYVNPSGRLDVLRISDRTLVASIDLLGQPDSIAISADKKYAAIAIENQRDENATPTGRAKGDLPQLPAGFVQDLVAAAVIASAAAAFGLIGAVLLPPVHRFFHGMKNPILFTTLGGLIPDHMREMGIELKKGFSRLTDLFTRLTEILKDGMDGEVKDRKSVV